MMVLVLNLELCDDTLVVVGDLVTVFRYRRTTTVVLVLTVLVALQISLSALRVVWKIHGRHSFGRLEVLVTSPAWC